MGVIHQAVGTVEPDYFQFYARLEGAEWRSDQVPQEGYEAHLWTSQGFVYIGTSRKFGTTSVLLEVLDVPPHEPDAEWQHVAEASLPADAGTTLQVHNWDGEAPALEVDIDTSAFCLRVHWQGLVEDHFEGMDANGESDERLLLQMWPQAEAEAEADTKVLRWWPPWDLSDSFGYVDGRSPPG